MISGTDQGFICFEAGIYNIHVKAARHQLSVYATNLLTDETVSLKGMRLLGMLLACLSFISHLLDLCLKIPIPL